MPQFTPAQSQFSAVGEIQTSPTVSLGIGTVNLRGVGTNRTLVLVDGRRGQPVNASLVVDLNTIPSAAIERVETITGGASAVYGADAHGGRRELRAEGQLRRRVDEHADRHVGGRGRRGHACSPPSSA